LTRILPALSGILILTSAVQAEDWPQFRGPTGQGIATGRLPTEWGPAKNIAWKQPIPGRGWSSPIVYKGRIYLTTAVPEGKGLSLRAMCLDAKDGKTLWNKEAFHPAGKTPRIHNKNSQASPTPLIDGQRLYVHFGHLGTAALDFDGKVLWRNNDFKYRPVHGNGGTFALVDNALVFSCDGANNPFVAALDRTDGHQLWKTERKTDVPKKFAFCTPLLIEVKGQKQVISPGAGAVGAYDPKDGKELWRVRYGDGYSVVPRPVFGHGLVYVSGGFDSHVSWKLRKGAPLTPSPLLAGSELYVVSDNGIASCLDAMTGKPHWQERIGGAFSASPILADGKVYFLSEDGTCTVVKASPKFEIVANNPMKERTLASFAAADGALYLRTEKNLYRIEAK
jgi:outer membrane protein assembly factor BamB